MTAAMLHLTRARQDPASSDFLRAELVERVVLARSHSERRAAWSVLRELFDVKVDGVVLPLNKG